MSAEYMHIGIPITNRKPNMVYNAGAKFWVRKHPLDDLIKDEITEKCEK